MSKIVFSNQPFGSSTSSGGKKSFSSSEYIYGRLELNGETLKQAFRLKDPDSTAPYPYLFYELSVFKNGEESGSSSNRNYVLIADEQVNSHSINIDVLPEPSKARTVFSILEDFSAGLGFVPLYHVADPDHFPEAGKYKVKIKIYSKSVNGWGQEEDPEKWPAVEDEFEFVFKEADAKTLMKNKEAATENIRNNAFRYDELPEVFSKPAKIDDPKATSAKVAAILKRDLPNRTILKWVIEPYDGSLWSIAKDEFDIPKYRYFNPHIIVAYKIDGECRIGTVTLRENYEGGGKYGELGVGFTSASEKQDRGIDCSKIK